MDEPVSLSRILELVSSNNKEGLLEVILNYRKEWNHAIKENDRLKKEIKLARLDFSGKSLRGVDFSRVDIEDSDFEGADLEDSDFSGANIKGTSFANADMKGAILYGARITQSSFSGANLYNAQTSNISLTGSVNLFGVYLRQAQEELYDTSPEITKQGFLMKEAYEHREDEEEDSLYRY